MILGPRIGKFGKDGRANPIPGHNIPYAVLGTRSSGSAWFGFNPGSTLSVDFGGFGYFAYAPDDEHRRRGRRGGRGS